MRGGFLKHFFSTIFRISSQRKFFPRNFRTTNDGFLKNFFSRNFRTSYTDYLKKSSSQGPKGLYFLKNFVLKDSQDKERSFLRIFSLGLYGSKTMIFWEYFLKGFQDHNHFSKPTDLQNFFSFFQGCQDQVRSFLITFSKQHRFFFTTNIDFLRIFSLGLSGPQTFFFLIFN